MAYRPMGMSFAGPTYEEDRRTADEYADEVKKYLERLEPLLTEHIANRRLREPGAMLRLALDNLTQRNFRQTWVHVHVDGLVRIWPEAVVDDIKHPGELPRRPRPMGKRKRVPSPYERSPLPQRRAVARLQANPFAGL